MMRIRISVEPNLIAPQRLKPQGLGLHKETFRIYYVKSVRICRLFHTSVYWRIFIRSQSIRFYTPDSRFPGTQPNRDVSFMPDSLICL